ncbi:hypothetical protein ACLB2K_003958 [Fragaria x ananassa]
MCDQPRTTNYDRRLPWCRDRLASPTPLVLKIEDWSSAAWTRSRRSSLQTFTDSATPSSISAAIRRRWQHLHPHQVYCRGDRCLPASVICHRSFSRQCRPCLLDRIRIPCRPTATRLLDLTEDVVERLIGGCSISTVVVGEA